MTIRWGIPGCGKVCEVKSRPGFTERPPAANWRSSCGAMRRLAEDYARRHGVARWSTDAESLILRSAGQRGLYRHAARQALEYALRVAAAGKPAYVEKPMARNHAECRRMVEAFARPGYRCSSPTIVAACAVLEDEGTDRFRPAGASDDAELSLR